MKKLETEIILPDTSLCAIVRDEMINPAQLPGKSGIRSFVESHVPYVEQAIIVDTGSVDGTRQELEQLALEFKNLKVYDRPFDNYIDSRNDSLAHVETKRSLILDVDELVTQETFRRVEEKLETLDPHSIHFEFAGIWSSGRVHTSIDAHHIRFFQTKDAVFRGHQGAAEYICYKRKNLLTSYVHPSFFGVVQLESNLGSLAGYILHFSPGKSESDQQRAISQKGLHGTTFKSDSQGTILKNRNWYDHPERFSESPSKRDGFLSWKHPNPNRVRFK